MIIKKQEFQKRFIKETVMWEAWYSTKSRELTGKEKRFMAKEIKRLQKISKKCQYIVTRAKSEEVDFYWSGNYTEVCRTYNKWGANLMFIWFALIKSPDGYNYTIIRLPGIQS